MVLLIDDDVLFRSALAEQLRDDGHEVHERDPIELTPLAALGRLLVVVTGHQMAGEDALAVARLFHDDDPTVPVIVLTGYSQSPVALASLEAAVAGEARLSLACKPIDYDDLHDHIHRVAIRTGG